MPLQGTHDPAVAPSCQSQKESTSQSPAASQLIGGFVWADTRCVVRRERRKKSVDGEAIICYCTCYVGLSLCLRRWMTNGGMDFFEKKVCGSPRIGWVCDWPCRFHRKCDANPITLRIQSSRVTSVHSAFCQVCVAS